MNNRYKKRIVLFLGLVVLMGFPSCQVLNRYRSPEIDSENLFRDENPLDTTTIANIPWREFFTDTFLQSYIDEAL
ncbi:MAG: TolC family protein, partial [Petrimonas sp.]|nr:TolC family protein [Petrimonas sp.]